MNKQLEKWFVGSGDHTRIDLMTKLPFDMEEFETLPFSMQWGVYLEFFRTQTEITIDDDGSGCIYLEDEKRGYYTESYNNHTDAQQEAIKKAFEILGE